MRPTPRIRRILALAIPAALSSLLDMLQVLVDLIMVGRLGADAIAAVGLSLQFLGLLMAFLSIFYTGTNALVSRFVGARETKEAGAATGIFIVFALFTSIPFTIGGLLYSGGFFNFMGTSESVRMLGMDYLGAYALCFPLFFANFVFSSAMAASGDTRTLLWIKIIMNLANTGLNYLLIYGHGGFPALGVKGAAIASALAIALQFILFLYLFQGGKTRLLFHWSWRPDLVWRMLRVGVPTGIERMATYGSFIIFTKLIADFGTAALAGYQVGLRIEGLAFMPGVGFTVAAMTLMGQHLGANDPDSAQQDVMTTAWIAAGLMGFLGIFMILTPHWLIYPFTQDPGTVQAASLYLQLVGISQVPLAMAFVLSGSLRGAGATRITLRINLISLWSLRILPGWALSAWFGGLIWIFIAMTVETFVKGGILWWVFQKGAWKNKKV